MKLIVSGEWLQKEGLFALDVKETLYPRDIRELDGLEGFVLLSYDLTQDLLGVSVKKTSLPPIVFLRVEKPRKIKDTFRDLKKEILLKETSLADEEFIRRIEKIKNYIEKGDVYQINLTCRFDFELKGSSEYLFFDFYSRQPVPYAFYLETEDFFVISGSMELFLEKRESLIRSKPIKGTGKTPEEILSSEKERAENLMITDMMRNDIGRVARTGTVRVSELFKVERYKTLCQMHSTVEGETDKKLSEIIRETFPPASVTGAPKRRAVEIINELEPHARGYYCGVAGFVKRNGDFILSVLIRTAYGSGSQISYFAGCGIVWDSNPQRELKELYMKIKAFYP